MKADKELHTFKPASTFDRRRRNGRASVGIFGKKEKLKPTTTTTMLYTLSRDMIAWQQAQRRQLSKLLAQREVMPKVLWSTQRF